MRWFVVAFLPLILSGCLLPTPISLATFGLDAVSYAVSGKTVTDHGISLAMGQDCALIGLLEGEVCDDQPAYEVADASAVLEPLPTSEQIALASGSDPQVYASARRAAAALGETWSTETDGEVLVAELGAIAPAVGDTAPAMLLSVSEQPPLPRSKPDHEVAASFEVVRHMVDERSALAASESDEGGSLADLADVALRAIGSDGDLLLAAAPPATAAGERRNALFGRSFWSEVGEAPRVIAHVDDGTRRETLAKRFSRPMEVGG